MSTRFWAGVHATRCYQHPCGLTRTRPMKIPSTDHSTHRFTELFSTGSRVVKRAPARRCSVRRRARKATDWDLEHRVVCSLHLRFPQAATTARQIPHRYQTRAAPRPTGCARALTTDLTDRAGAIVAFRPRSLAGQPKSRSMMRFHGPAIEAGANRHVWGSLRVP